MMNTGIDLTADELRGICGQWRYSPREELMDEETDERAIRLKHAMSLLETSDFIIYCLYLEYQSERKVASVLNVSRTPIHKCLVEIKQQIMDNYRQLYGISD